ncbi:MAG TPA: SH3 domain-containing protein [Bacteroidales bacterium]|nr:SH3 domain-containing protein [Bacteroidales bacterium]HPS16445.1 SH3 domain-containing protein [Bacteroidales bacterium]
MKNIFYSLIIVLSAMLASCGGSDGDKNKSKDDSINNDSIIGIWNEVGKSASLKIEKAGELFTITSSNGLKYAYKLNGQVLTSVDGTGPIYSIIGCNELLKGSTKYTKNGSDNFAVSSEQTSAENTKSTSSKTTISSTETSPSKSSKSASNANTSTNTTTTTKTSNANELTIVSDNMINIRQSPRASSTIIKGVSNGETFKILEKGKQLVTVSGKTDYWYKIKVGGDVGWVFGSFTSLKQQ